MPIFAPVLSELSLSLVGDDVDDVDDGDTGDVADVDKVDEVSKETVEGAWGCQYMPLQPQGRDLPVPAWIKGNRTSPLLRIYPSDPHPLLLVTRAA